MASFYTKSVGILSFLVLTSTSAFAATNSDLSNEVKALTAQVKSLQARQQKIEKKVSKRNEVVVTKASATTSSTVTKSNPKERSNQSLPNILQASSTFPYSFGIPGTETRMKVFGMLGLNGTYDSRNPTNYNYSLSSIPITGTAAAKQPGMTRFHARNSVFGIETRTPTSLGDFKTYLSLVFYDSFTAGNEIVANRHTANLYLAYGELGPVLAGQTYSNFLDVYTYPESFDIFNNVASTQVIQPQVRYTYKLANGIKLAAALENPESDFYTTGAPSSSGSVYTRTSPLPSYALTSTQGIAGRDNYPDLTLSASALKPWGSWSINGMVRKIEAVNTNSSTVSNPNGPSTSKANATSYAVSVSGRYNVYNKDNVLLRYVIGKGVGRYVSMTSYEGAFYDAPTNQLVAPLTQGGYAGYQHWWTNSLRSNLIYGRMHVNTPTEFTFAAMNKDLQSVTANLVWSPVPRVDAGIEYIYGKRELMGVEPTTANNTTGYANRVQLGVKYFF